MCTALQRAVHREKTACASFAQECAEFRIPTLSANSQTASSRDDHLDYTSCRQGSRVDPIASIVAASRHTYCLTRSRRAMLMPSVHSLILQPPHPLSATASSLHSTL